MMKTAREQRAMEAEAFCAEAVKKLAQAAESAGMVVTYPVDGHSWTAKMFLNGVTVQTPWKPKLPGFSARFRVGDYGEGRSYQIRRDGSFNVEAILEYVRKILAAHQDAEQARKARDRRIKEDEQLSDRLAPMHKGIGQVMVRCEFGKTAVTASHLDEEQAKRVLAALAEVLRPLPSVGEVWQHRRVQMPSRVTSVRGMIRLVSLENKQTCAIPRREFLESWDLVSAAEEQEDG